MIDLNSVDHIASRLRAEFSEVKLLALGQTVYWDEPMKAILRRHLDEHCPETQMLAGIHDADYFSKIPSTLNLPSDWAILSHNDGTTRDLWVAAAELSRFFGSETIPTRDLLTSHEVQLDKIAKNFDKGREALVDMATQAWGWRGLVHADSGNEISCVIPLSDALPHVLELLEWGFSRTLDTLDELDAQHGRRIADELLSEVQAYSESNPEASITDMYRDFLPRFYTRLLGYQPENLELAAASHLFRFNKETAALPRFNPLKAFLNPQTRTACQEVYDLAVQGSDTYTLDRFCPGAMPFDLVVPGMGRGTICLRDGELVIDFDEPVSIPSDEIPSTPEELAALVEDRFGRDTALVGKALTLVLMMASEFIFVLHEQASAYVPRCRKMAALLKERGVDLPFYPILRIGYHTWDSLGACDVTFNLPGHLASAFRQGDITSGEFADSWRSVLQEQEELLRRMALTSGMDSLLAFLAEQQGDPWPSRIEEYTNAHAAIRKMSEQTEPLKEESINLRDLSHRIKQEIQQLEIEKGQHFRDSMKPLSDRLDYLEAEGRNPSPEAQALADDLQKQTMIREGLERNIEQKRKEAQHAHSESLKLKHEVQSLERGDELRQARETLKRIEHEAELARLWLVRDAILVTQGLRYTDHRPSAWWFMLVDPELKWFNRVAETAEFRFEEINPIPPG